MKTKNSFREIGLSVLGLVIVGVVTVIIIGTFRGRDLSEVPITSTPHSTATFEEPTTAIPYPVPLENPLTPTAAAWQTAEGPIDTQYAIMLATDLASTPSPTPLRTFAPTGTREGERIKPSGQKMGLDAQNAWVGILNGRPVSVYAGALSGVPEQGAIYIFVELPGRSVNEQILTPTKHGGVRVVSEYHNLLTLVSTDGTTYYFSIPARRFVASRTGVVPSATPPNTFTPVPPPPTLGGSTPVPQTYNPYPAPTGQSTAAYYWQNLSSFSNYQKYTGPMFFVGTLTEHLSCNDACGDGNNYPWEGFQLLSRALASDVTSRQAMRWSTDITKLLN